ncbi:MAG: hypothetical protein A2X79_05985 [Desulfuromonadaceae bacterium GWB2_53_15]|nr:MAG: hypothetical protein A2X79_05985 [Desulfuromonadaceae bacterium GWB2_53_15]
MLGYVKPVFFVFMIVLVPGVIGGCMAANRARNVPVWCLLCALLPPLLLFIYFAKPLREVEGKFRQCSNCRKFIKWHEPVCKHCNSRQIESRTGKGDCHAN